MSTITPALPTDLEREIFEETYWLCEADESLSSVVNLLLVCHRVRQWLAVLLYRIAVHSPPPNRYYPRTRQFLSSGNLEHLGPYVKHLYIGGPTYNVDTVRKILISCPSLIDFAFLSAYQTMEFIDLLEKLKLQRLFTDLSSLNEEHFKGSAFASITHLDITNFGGSWERWGWLRHAPQLTHVAVNGQFEGFDSAMHLILKNCKKLKTLLVPRWKIYSANCLANVRDHRIVRMDIQRYTVEDWEETAKGTENSIWACATRISRARKAVEFSDDYYKTWFKCWGGWKEQLFSLAKDDTALNWLQSHLL